MTDLADLSDRAAVLQARLQAILGGEVHFGMRTEAGLWPVEAGHPELEAILVNLVDNSQTLLVGGGRLSIEIINYVVSQGDTAGPAPGRYVRIVVDHTGYMTEEAARALEAAALTSGRQGAASSLAIVYGIVQSAGGYVHFISQRGKGTRAEIYLPVAASPAPGRLEGTAGQIDRTFAEREVLREAERTLENSNHLPEQ